PATPRCVISHSLSDQITKGARCGSHSSTNGNAGENRDSDRLATVRVNEIDRVTERIDVNVSPTREQRRVLRSPPPDPRVVVPRAEADEVRIAVEQPSGEAEWRESGIRVEEDVPELV